MKALIIDDEPLARRELKRLLNAFPSVVIIGEASNIIEGEQQISNLAPDLIFLDIQMPGGTGFDLLDRLEEVPQVIFTTAYDQHAVQAFKVNALDYLLKPIEPERLASAMDRVRRTPKPTVDGASRAPLDQVFVRDGSKCWFVPMNEVRLIASEGNYFRIFWEKGQPLLHRSLLKMEARIDPKRFFRANRQQIISLDFVEGVEMGLGGRLHVQLRGGPEVEISRRHARVFRSRMDV